MIGNTPVSISSGSFPQIPAGMYTAKITDVNVVNVVNQWNPEGANKLEYHFEIMNEGVTSDGKQLQGQTLRARSSLSFGTKSNLYKIYSAVLGRVPSQGEKTSFHPDNIVGSTVQIMVEQREGAQGGMFSNIVGYSPAAGQSMAAPAPQAVAQPVAAPVTQAPVAQAPAPVASQGVQVAQTAPAQGGNLPWEK